MRDGHPNVVFASNFKCIYLEIILMCVQIVCRYVSLLVCYIKKFYNFNSFTFEFVCCVVVSLDTHRYGCMELHTFRLNWFSWWAATIQCACYLASSHFNLFMNKLRAHTQLVQTNPYAFVTLQNYSDFIFIVHSTWHRNIVHCIDSMMQNNVCNMHAYAYVECIVINLNTQSIWWTASKPCIHRQNIQILWILTHLFWSERIFCQ